MALTKITKSGITDSAVDNNKIEADAVDATKIADNAISEEHLDTSAIIGNTELAESANANDILLIYDASAGTIKKILSSNVGVQAPIFLSVSPTNVLTGDGTGNATFTITGANFDATATAKLKTTGGADLNFDSVTRDSATQITGVIAISSLSNANEPYDVAITNGNGLNTIAADQININAQPVYVTASGSLGDSVIVGNAGSFSVNATDPESAGNVTFELQSGSLPPGYSITNTAAEGGTAIISGTDNTTSSTTTFNFVLRAVDAASNTTSRSFSITSRALVSESFTSSGTFSVPSGITSADVLVVAGGGSAGKQHGGGGGAGGLIFFPSYPVTPSGTITVTVGCGGAGSANPFTNDSGQRGQAGQDSVFGSPGDPGLTPTGGVLTSKGGGDGGTWSNPWNQCHSAGGPGGSGSGAGPGATSPSPGVDFNAGSATQPTQPGNSGAYGFGNPGGYALGTNHPLPNAGYSGGGGGGAGASGTPVQPGPNAGDGGDGRAYTIADGTTPVYYAGGGGGGSHNSPDPGGGGGTGGQGGGGPGNTVQGNVTANPGQNGAFGEANKGGGGGGSAVGNNPPLSCASAGGGGKGVVIVRY